jgi:hypothetical protein
MFTIDHIIGGEDSETGNITADQWEPPERALRRKPPNYSLISQERRFVDALNGFSQAIQWPQTRTTDSVSSIPSEVALH